VAALAALICAVPQAYADKKSKPKGDDEPFSQGVSKAKQEQAIALFEEGNKLFEEEKYSDALELYEKAIKKWDHPKIEFNLALCYSQIKKPLEARSSTRARSIIRLCSRRRSPSSRSAAIKMTSR
jgi:tetratricopeptide (TPR) repeat protein